MKLKIFIIILFLSLNSCTNKEDPSKYDLDAYTYIIEFNGDTQDFTGRISVYTTSESCILNSDSFNNNQSNNSYSDTSFSKTYNLTLSVLKRNSTAKIHINCVALCISSEKMKLVGYIKKISSDGKILINDTFEINSFDKNYKPTFEEYSYSLEI